ncbi:MAG: type 4a pilus biogenesis protein PilO [Planctomycetota bacterium]
MEENQNKTTDLIKKNAAPIIAILILAILFFTIFKPQISKILSLREELNESRDKLRSSHEMIDNLVHVAYEYEEASTRLSAIKNDYPEEHEIPGIFKEITSTAEELNLKIGVIEPQPEERKNFLIRVPKRITLTGDYKSIGEYLERISDTAKLLVIRKLEMNTENNVYPQLSIDILLDAYFISTEEVK